MQPPRMLPTSAVGTSAAPSASGPPPSQLFAQNNAPGMLQPHNLGSFGPQSIMTPMMPQAGPSSQILHQQNQTHRPHRQHVSQPSEQHQANRQTSQQPQQSDLQQQQHQAALTQLLAIAGSGMMPPASLAQQHASVLSDARNSVSSFSDALQEAKLSCPGDRQDIRAVVVALERASKALSSELTQGVVKLRSLNDSLSIGNAAQQHVTGFANTLPQQDMFNPLPAFNVPGQHQRNAQDSGQQSFPFDINSPYQQQPQNNPMFEFNNPGNINGFNSPFGHTLGLQQQPGNPAQSPRAFSPAVAHYLSQTPEANRPGALNLFQSVANVIGAGGGPEAIRSSPNPFETLLSQHRASLGMDLSSAPNVPTPMTNAAALEALTSLGVTPAMLEALGLGSLVNQVNSARSGSPTKSTMQFPNNQPRNAGANEEPSRKKPKLGKRKHKDSTHDGATGRGAGPSHASSSVTSHILGVGLRQEGDKRFRNRKLLRDLREHLYRWLGTNEFRKLSSTYKVAEWVPNPSLTQEEKRILANLPPGGVAQPPITTHIFHVDFTSRDFYRTNQSLIDAIVTEASKKVEAKPEGYGIVPGTIDRDHLEDVAKDLMDSARSGFRMSLRTGLQAEKEDKEKHERYRGVERAKTKCRNREIGALRLRHAIPRQMLIPGAYSDDAASDEDLHGLTKSEWKRQRLRKLRIAKGWEAVTPKWRNKHLTRAYHKADIVSKSKQMARWRRDEPVDLPIPIKLYGKTLPKQLFDAEWLAQHRAELEDEPYCIKINDAELEGWNEQQHPLGEDTSDEMEWSDTKDNEASRRHPRRVSASAESSIRSPVASGSGTYTRTSAHKRTAKSEPKQEDLEQVDPPTTDRASAPATAPVTEIIKPDVEMSADAIPSAASLSSAESHSSNSGKSSSSSSGDSNSGGSSVAGQLAKDDAGSEAGSDASPVDTARVK